jgi:hypothetical protein
MAPSRTDILITAAEDSRQVFECDSHCQGLSFWEDVYGFRMSAMRRAAEQEDYVLADVDIVDERFLASDPCTICVLISPPFLTFEES